MSDVDADYQIAHITDIYSLAVTPNQIISAAGSSALKVHSTTEPNFALAQTLERAHKLGCHHLATSRNGSILASAGFGGEVTVWTNQDEHWAEKGSIVGTSLLLYRCKVRDADKR
jgi:superkiller protein 8